MLFELNQNKCIGCGKCAADCSQAVLAMENGIPTVKREENCFNCQHCLTICPVGAISVNGVNPESCALIADMDLPTSRQIDNLMLVRRSVRCFKLDVLPKPEIEEMVRILANGPTGCNQQELQFKVVYGREKMMELLSKMIDILEQSGKISDRFIRGRILEFRRYQRDAFFRGAPHLLLVSAPATSVTPQTDCDAAVANFSLMATARGLGTTWCGMLHIIAQVVPEIKNIFGLKTDDVFYAMVFGYPDIKYIRGVNRINDLPLEFLE